MRRQSAQAMVETIVAIPVVLMLTFGALELILGYRAYLTFDYAVQEAARLASMNNAQYPAMRRGLARGLAPLYTAPVAGMSDDEVLRRGFERATREVDGYTLTVRLNPPPRAFDASAHGREQTVGWSRQKIVAIPHGRLVFRNPEVKEGLSIQDANLLKIEVRWCYPLIAPIISRLLDQDPDDRTNPNRLHQPGEPIPGGTSVCDGPDGARRGITLRTDAIVRMQSDAYRNCNERDEVPECRIPDATRHWLPSHAS